MEGFRNLVFKGDKIVWQIFFRHYLRCLEEVCRAYVLWGEKLDYKIADLMPLYTESEDFPAPMYKNLFDKIYKDFIKVCEKAIDKLSVRTIAVSREEFLLYLKIIHYYALEIIQKHYIKQGFTKKIIHKNISNTQMLDMIIKMIDAVEESALKQNQNDLETTFNLARIFKHSSHWNMVKNTNQSFASQDFILFEFIDFYMQSLEKLMYPKSYVACFMEEATNSSVWSHYGDGHKGICLIFGSYEYDGKQYLKLHGKRHSKKEGQEFDFKKVTYENSYNEVNFFENIGRLPKQTLINTWYVDEQGNKGILMDKIFMNQDKQLNQYRHNFYNELLIKGKDWDYEKEYRIMMDSSLGDAIDKENRKIKYDFQYLQGIIFGMRTSIQDKIRIFHIIKQKCKKTKRQEFDFYQAYYCPKNKNIQYSFLMGFDDEWN